MNESTTTPHGARLHSRPEAKVRLYASYVSANKGLLPLGARVSDPGGERMAGYYAAKLEPWLAGVPREGRVADLGCGPGVLLRAFERLGFRNAEGVELSAEQAELARTHGLRVAECDLFEFLAGRVAEFDMLACFDVIEHLDLGQAMRLCDLAHAALKPGGLFLLQTPNGDAPWVGPVFAGDLTHETLFTPHSLRHLLCTCGFDVLGFQEHTPLVRGPASAVRAGAWQALRLGYALQHLVETGSTPSGIHTRVFRAVARNGAVRP